MFSICWVILIRCSIQSKYWYVVGHHYANSHFIILFRFCRSNAAKIFLLLICLSQIHLSWTLRTIYMSYFEMTSLPRHHQSSLSLLQLCCLNRKVIRCPVASVYSLQFLLFAQIMMKADWIWEISFYLYIQFLFYIFITLKERNYSYGTSKSVSSPRRGK